MKLYPQLIGQTAEFRALTDAFRAGRLPACVTGASAVHKANIIAALCSAHHRRALILAADEAEAQRFQRDLAEMGMHCAVYPYRDLVFRAMESHSREYERMRLSVLAAVRSGAMDGVICCADAALQCTIPPQELDRRTVRVHAGDTLPPSRLLAALTRAGY